MASRRDADDARSLPRVVLIVTALLTSATIALGGGAAMADDGDGTGSGLGVTVVDETPTPTPTPTRSSPSGSGGSGSSGGSQGGSGGGGGFGSSGGSGGSTPAGSGATPTPTPTAGAIAKWIVVTGLDSSAQAALDPLAGRMHVRVSVANRSTSTPVSGTVVFRMYNIFGVQIGSSVSRAVTGIPPEDMRTSTATLDGVGQWTVLRVTATFTPKGAEDDATLVRETWVLALPWLLVAIGVLVAATLIILRLRRGRPVGGES